MPYNHDEVVASMTEFYNFLTTHLHFNPSELKTPPPAGWAHISPPLFPHQSKSNTVIDLLHHLPYLPGGNTQEKWIYDHTVCADYTDKRIELGVELSVEEVAESCPWEKLQDPSRQEHIVALGTPETGDAGSFIYLDTLDGEVAVWDFDEIDYLSFDSAREFYAWLKKKFEELKIFPVPGLTGGPDHVVPMTEDRHQGYKDFVKSLGWPVVDGSGWKRDEAMKELQRVYPSYHRGCDGGVGAGDCARPDVWDGWNQPLEASSIARDSSAVH